MKLEDFKESTKPKEQTRVKIKSIYSRYDLILLSYKGYSVYSIIDITITILK